jgi:chitodextrinase
VVLILATVTEPNEVSVKPPPGSWLRRPVAPTFAVPVHTAAVPLRSLTARALSAVRPSRYGCGQTIRSAIAWECRARALLNEGASMRVHPKFPRAVTTCVVVLSVACREPLPPEASRSATPGVSLAVGSKDHSAPTAPTNLRATNIAAFSVSLAWGPSADNSGVFSYRVRDNRGYEFAVAQSQTSYVWMHQLEASTTYTFSVYAVDGSGNKSKASTVIVTTAARDVTPPSAPVISVTDVAPRQISLAWSSTDDSPSIIYTVSVNGAPDPEGATSSTSRTFYLLEPATAYTFTVTARDKGGNWSTPSQVTVTTKSIDLNDHDPPTAPGNVGASGFADGSTELLVTWTASTDNVDPQSQIRYEVFINGTLNEVVVGTTRTTTYGVVGTNTIEVFAIDTAGNRSPAGVTTVVIQL